MSCRFASGAVGDIIWDSQHENQRKQTTWHAYAVDPLGIEEGLIVEGGLIEPLPLHVEEVAALERDGANTADFIGSDGTSERDLAGH